MSQDEEEQLGSAIHALGTHRGNSWFEASLDQAVKVFLSVLPRETGEPPMASDTPAHESTDGVLQPVEAHDIGEEPTDESNDSLDMETDDPIWDYVQACSTREATKCVDIRAALEEKVGKVEAQKLLARAKPTVAQDASGKKNRVLKLGNSLLKLK